MPPSLEDDMDTHHESEEYGSYGGAGLAVIRSDSLTSESRRGQALSILTRASSTRIDDPELEQQRIELLAAALSAAREASDALHSWQAQLLSEYRGSRTAWDLQATSERLERALAHFDDTVRDTAVVLRTRMPAIADPE
jgi:hypothetical protein